MFHSYSRLTSPGIAFLLVFIQCYSAPALHYTYRAEPNGSTYSIHSITNFRSLYFKTTRSTSRPFETRGLFLSREQLRREARRLDPDFADGSPPEVTALYLAVLNYGDTPVRLNTYWFQIRDTGDDRIFRPIDAREYSENYGGFGNYPYVYEYAFAQKDSLRFSHPVPDWYASLFLRHTLSPAEEEAHRKNRLRRGERRHERRSVLAPGRETKALLIFPSLAPGREYVLEYRAEESRSDLRAFVFEPLRFRLDTRREDAAELRNVRESETEQEERELREERGQQILEELRRENERELRELYRMHRQRRRHEELLTPAETRAQTNSCAPCRPGTPGDRRSVSRASLRATECRSRTKESA